MSLAGEIHSIAKEMVDCMQHCEGITNDPEKGILPRCLILEDTNTGGAGAAVVGINPGKAKKGEREFYVREGRSYAQVLAYWQSNLPSYY